MYQKFKRFERVSSEKNPSHACPESPNSPLQRPPMLLACCVSFQRYGSKGSYIWEWILSEWTNTSLYGRLSLDKEVPGQREQDCLNPFNYLKSLGS